MARFSVEAVFRGVDRISAPVSRMQARIRRFSERAERRIRAISEATQALTRGMANVGKGAAFGAAGLTTGITLVNNATNRVETMAEAMGVNADTIRSVGFATKSLGLDLDSVTDLVEEMNNKLGESAGIEELTPVTESLHILGLEYENLRDLSPDEQFRAIADAALKMEDGAKAAAAADILLGGEANKIISTMRLQGKSMAEIEARFKEVNFLTEEGKTGARAWGASMGFTTTLVETLGQQVSGLAGTALAPMLDLLNETAVANKEVINKALIDFFAEVADTVKFLIENFSTVVIWIKRIATGLAIFFTFTAVLKGLVLVLTAVNLVMAANPIVLLILGITALVSAAITLMGGWGAVGDFFSNMWAGIVADFKQFKSEALGFVDDIKSIPDKLPNFSLSSLNPFADDDEEKAAILNPPDPSRNLSDAPIQLISPETRAAKLTEEKTTTSKVDISLQADPGTKAAMKTTGPMTGVSMALANSGDFP